MNNNRSLAWVPALLIVMGLGPVTWLLPSTIGYLLSGAFVLLLIAYVFVDQNISVEPIQMIVITLLAVYWIGLVLQFGLTGMTSFLPYIMVTPPVIIACLVVAPGLVHRNPHQYARAVVIITVFLTLIGFGILYLSLITQLSFPFTGKLVMGKYPFRIASITDNSNTYGALTIIGFLTAVYLRIETGKGRWTISAVLLLIGILLSDSRTALVAATVGAFVLLVWRSNHKFITTITSSIVVILAVLAFPAEFYQEADESLQIRFETWELVVAEIETGPLIGEAFQGTFNVHNSYLSILLDAGLFFGVIYLLAFVVAFGYAITKAIRGSLWDIYVFATLIALLIRMITENTTLGGLSVISLLLALYIGFAACPPRGLRYTVQSYRHYQRYNRSAGQR